MWAVNILNVAILERRKLKVKMTDKLTTIEESFLHKQLLEIIRKKPSIDTIFKASPYDNDHAIEKAFTEQVFRKYCFSKSNHIKEFINNLSLKIDDVKKNYQYIFFTGFPGNGKTTCIREFIHKNINEYNHLYVDVHRHRGEFNNPDKAILDILKIHIKENSSPVSIIKALMYVKTYKSMLLDNGLISQHIFEFFKQIEINNATIDDNFANKALSEFTYLEVFTIFFIQLLLGFDSDEKKHIIYFDNLDVVSMEYLSDKFFEYFHEGVRNGRKLVTLNFPEIDEKQIAFENSFRFVFCLRDGNGETIKQHLKARMDYETISIQLDAEHYSNILEKRLKFTKILCSKAKPVKSKHFKIIEEMVANKAVGIKFKALLKDDYFKNVLVPLFNRDYRKISDLIINENLIGGYGLNYSIYGIRGNIVFKIIKHLLRDGLKGDNFVVTYLKANNRGNNEGYCYPTRVLLTVGLNLSLYSRGSVSRLTILNLLEHLGNIYSVEQIVDCIVECFLYHQGNWSHLLTILSQTVASSNKERFKKEIIKQFNEINEISRKITENTETLLNCNSVNSDERSRLENSITSDEYKRLTLRNNLDSINLRINEAGFAYIRHILPHFEFYSAIREENTHSLFEFGTKKDSKTQKFLFETTIDSVIEIVRNHIKSMKNFFQTKYQNNNIISKERFYSSPYCFKYYGISDVPQEKGYFHSTRMITQQIDYIDKFRMYLLRTEPLSEEKVIEINKSLISKIDIYLNLLGNSIDDEGKNKFVNGFKEKVKTIVDGGYKDTITPIRLDKEGKED
jgi:hypothetical protein